MPRPALLILSGLPGTGKTTLARGIAARLNAVFLRIDSIEHALAESVLKITPAEDAGYMAAYAIAEDNLLLGRIVVADSVNPIELTRSAWRAIAERAGCMNLDIEVLCSDKAEHQRRVEMRSSDLPGKKLPTWENIQKREYQQWHEDRIVIDTAGKFPDQSVDELYSQLKRY